MYIKKEVVQKRKGLFVEKEERAREGYIDCRLYDTHS